MYDVYHRKGEISCKQPCKKDCPERSGECRSTCEKWKEFEGWKMAQYDVRRKRMELNERSANAKPRLRRDEKARMSHRKHNK